jgi:hypothetical protein
VVVDTKVVAPERKIAHPLRKGEAKSQRDAEIIRMLDVDGLEPHEVARRTGLSYPRILQIRNEAGSGRTRLMVALRNAADERGQVAMANWSQMVAFTNISTHEAKHLVMTSLARAGLLIYVETQNQNGNGSPFKRITITPKGLRWKGATGKDNAVDLVTTQEIAPRVHESIQPPLPENTEKSVPEVPETPENDENGSREPEMELQAPEKAPETGFAVLYPTLHRLRSRKADLEATAKTLELYGLEVEAVAALDAAGPSSDLEREILSYIAANEEE